MFWALAGAEALSASNSLSLKHKEVLNAKNAGAIFCHAQVFYNIHTQLIFLGSRDLVTIEYLYIQVEAPTDRLGS